MFAVSNTLDDDRRDDLSSALSSSPKPLFPRSPRVSGRQQFNGQHGRAYLFEKAVNIVLGDPEDRPMTTGMHTVRDVMCAKCDATLGWKYEKAFEQAQKYKEGKVILEKALLVDVQ